jgi:beta-galactosidase
MSTKYFRAFWRILAPLATLFFVSAAVAASDSAPGPRVIIPFDTDWRFRLGDDPAARQINFDDSSWRVLDVPHDWSIEGPMARPPEGEAQGGFFTHGIGWYRKSFTLSATRGQKTIVEFDGVYMNSEVSKPTAPPMSWPCVCTIRWSQPCVGMPAREFTGMCG